MPNFLVELIDNHDKVFMSEAVQAKTEESAVDQVKSRAKKNNPGIFKQGHVDIRVSDYPGEIEKPKKAKKEEKGGQVL